MTNAGLVCGGAPYRHPNDDVVRVNWSWLNFSHTSSLSPSVILPLVYRPFLRFMTLSSSIWGSSILGNIFSGYSSKLQKKSIIYGLPEPLKRVQHVPFTMVLGRRWWHKLNVVSNVCIVDWRTCFMYWVSTICWPTLDYRHMTRFLSKFNPTSKSEAVSRHSIPSDS